VVEMSAKTRNLERPTAVLLVKVVGGGGMCYFAYGQLNEGHVRSV
jgi:hypothetical protein